MAAGDITGHDKQIIDPSTNYVPIVAHRGNNLFVVAYKRDSNTIIQTYSVAGDGTITTIDSWNIGVNTGTLYVFLVNGSTFALAYTDSGAPWQGYVKTFSVAADGTITKAWIASHTFQTDGAVLPYIRCEPVYHANNVWLLGGQTLAAGQGLKVWSIHISDDGSSISTVDTQVWNLTQNKVIAMAQANGDIYAVYSEQLINQQVIYTFQVDATGNITAKSSLQLGVVAPYNPAPGMFKVIEGLICISRTTGLETRTIGLDGSIGDPPIDTEVFGEQRFWLPVGANIWTYISGAVVYTKTFLDDGTIGAQVDSYDFAIANTGVSHPCHGEGSMYTAAIPGGNVLDLYICTYEIEGAPSASGKGLLGRRLLRGAI